MASVRRYLLLLWFLLGPVAAHAAETYRCADPTADGASWGSCSSVTTVSFESLVATDLVMHCVGGVHGMTCGAAGGAEFWRVVSGVQDDWLIWNQTDNQYQTASLIAGFSYGDGPGPDPEPDGEFDFSDLDLERLGGLFAAGFVLVGGFWALGKSVSVVLGVIKAR